jgi:hypothetical protein
MRPEWLASASSRPHSCSREISRRLRCSGRSSRLSVAPCSPLAVVLDAAQPALHATVAPRAPPAIQTGNIAAVT